MLVLVLAWAMAEFSLAAQQPRASRGAEIADWAQRAQQAQQAGNWTAAESAWRHVLTLVPSAAAWGNLGNVLKHEGRRQEAIHAFREGLKLQPKLAGLQLDLALVYFGAGDYAHAIPPLKAFVAKNPDNLQGVELLGICELNHAEYAAAVASLEHAAKLEGTPDVALLYALASAQTMAGQTDAAHQTLALMLQLGSDSAPLHLLLGEAEAHVSHIQQAMSEFQKALALDPRLLSVHLQMGLAQLKARRYSAAVQQFSEELKGDANCAECYFERGAAEFMQHQDEAAGRDFTSSIRLQPKNHDAWYYLARLELREDKKVQAVASLRQAIAANDQQPASHYLLGRTLSGLGQQAESKKELALADRLHQQEDHRSDAALQKDFHRVLQGAATASAH